MPRGGVRARRGLAIVCCARATARSFAVGMGIAGVASHEFARTSRPLGLMRHSAFGLALAASACLAELPVAAVVISPATAWVPVGQEVQLTATIKGDAGNVLTGRGVTWTTSNASVATVSGSGLVRGVTVGTIRITATSEGKSASADLTITTPPAAPWPHEPAGFTAILNQPWTTDMPPMTSGLPGNHALVTDQSDAPVSPPGAMDFWYPAGLVAGYSEFGRFWFHVPRARISKEVFIGVAFKLSSAFQGEASGVQKLFFLSAHGTGANDFWVEVGGSGSNPLNLRVVTEFQGLASAEYEPNVKNFLSTPVAGETNVIVDRGVWHKYEIYLKLPDVSGGAGTCMIWVDGTLALNRDPSLPLDRAMPMAFSGTGWAELNVDPIWGGGGSVKAHRDDIWYDHLYISTR